MDFSPTASGRWFASCAAALLLTGCAAFDTSMDTTGMDRTVTTRDASGQTRTVRMPYPSGEKKSEPQAGGWFKEEMGKQSAPSVPVAGIPSVHLDAQEASLPDPLEDVPAVKTGPVPAAGQEPDLPAHSGPTGGIIDLRLWTKLTTRFSSPSFTNPSWREHPRLSAPGWEGGWIWSDRDQPFGVLARLGLFRSDMVLNSQRQGGRFVRENVHLNGGYLDGGVEVRAMDGLRLEMTLGAFYYHAGTSVDTDAPVFTYEGIRGDRLLGIFGLGGRVETPWRFPLRLYVGGRLYLPFGLFDSEQDVLENAFGQGNAGLTWRF